jgi:hypothetical protein
METANYTVPETAENPKQIDQTLYLINELVRVCGSLYVKQNVSDTIIEDLLETFKTTNNFPQIQANFLTSENIAGIVTFPSLYHLPLLP